MAVKTRSKPHRNGTAEAVKEAEPTTDIEELLAKNDLASLGGVKVNGDAIAEYMIRQANEVIPQYQYVLVQSLIDEHSGEKLEAPKGLGEMRDYLDAVREEFDDVIAEYKVDAAKYRFPVVEPDDATKLQISKRHQQIWANTVQAKLHDHAIAKRLYDKAKDANLQERIGGVKRAEEEFKNTHKRFEHVVAYIEHLEGLDADDKV